MALSQLPRWSSSTVLPRLADVEGYTLSPSSVQRYNTQHRCCGTGRLELPRPPTVVGIVSRLAEIDYSF